MRSRSTVRELEKRIESLENELKYYQNKDGSDQLNQQYLEGILNNTNAPIFLKDANYKYLFMNRRFGDLARVSYEQVRDKDDFDIFSEPVAQLFRSQDEEVVMQRKLLEFEETVDLPDGVQTFITAKFPLFDDDGKVDAVGGVCTNITARKKVEAELKEAALKYRGIFEHSPFGILHIDKNSIITACNEKLAEILGSSIEKITGFDLLQSIKDEKIRSATICVLSGKLAHYDGSYLSVTSGKRVNLRGVFSPISTSDGSTIAAIGIVEDITGRKDAEDALLKAHNELERRVADRTAQLDRRTERLKETNVALKILLDKREEDKKLLEEEVMFNVKKLIAPYLEKLKMSCREESQEALLDIIKSNLNEITSPFAPNYKNYLSSLTPAQIQIADLIRQGLTTKEIAAFLKLSPSTIACHRQEIRKRLLLTNEKTNLRSALTAIS